MNIKQVILGLITALIVTPPVGVSYAQEPSPTPTATPVPTGSIVIVQDASCTTRRFSECERFTFHGSSASIGDFTLHAVRDNEGDDARSFVGLRTGTYVVTQRFADFPLRDIECRNGLGRRNLPAVSVHDGAVVIDLQANETVTCTFFNAPEPTATPTPVPSTATATPAATSTPVIVREQIFVPMPVVQTVIVPPTATLAPAVSVRPPATGSAGMLP